MSVWLQVTSGRGPEECEWVAARVVEKLQEEGKVSNWICYYLTREGEINRGNPEQRAVKI